MRNTYNQFVLPQLHNNFSAFVSWCLALQLSSPSLLHSSFKVVSIHSKHHLQTHSWIDVNVEYKSWEVTPTL